MFVASKIFSWISVLESGGNFHESLRVSVAGPQLSELSSESESTVTGSTEANPRLTCSSDPVELNDNMRIGILLKTCSRSAAAIAAFVSSFIDAERESLCRENRFKIETYVSEAEA